MRGVIVIVIMAMIAVVVLLAHRRFTPLVATAARDSQCS
jgi:hypothetical protein